MRRFLVILLLALLPLQFSWAAVTAHCTHEIPADASQFGHDRHPHQADAGPGAGPVADAMSDTDAPGDEASGDMDLDCGHCHGCCSGMLTLPAALPGKLLTAPPSATLHDVDGAYAPTRPERPQWLPLA